MISMRTAFSAKLLLSTGITLALAVGMPLPASSADDQTVIIGVTLPLTGDDAQDAKLVDQGFEMAIDQANERHEIPGHRLALQTLNTATSATGQYDPAQAATAARTLIANPHVVANLGPYMSGEGKAMAPLLSTANLPTITPTSTNPDITSPKFAKQFRPAGNAIYFRTCTTDAFQGPFMANYMKEVLHIKSVFVFDDSGAGGVGGADAFQARAKQIGLDVLGRDHLDPLAADYAPALTRVKALNADAIYYAGVAGAGVKLIKQSYDIIPNAIKAGVDGIYGPDILTGAGFPAVQNWYITMPAPHIVDTPAGAQWAADFVKRFGNQPSDYSALAYDAGLVAVDAIRRVAASGTPIDRQNVQQAIQQTRIKTLQGEVAFDDNGDVENRIISVFQVEHDPKYPSDDVAHQFKYIGTAPPQ